MKEKPKRRSTSKFAVVEYRTPEGEWRRAIRSVAFKFDDAAKKTFLEEYSKHGRKTDSALRSGVSLECVNRALEDDPEFAEACLQAQEIYHDRLTAHIQNLIFEGTEKLTYDRNGQLVSSEKKYPIRLIEMEKKKLDAGWRDRKEQTINFNQTSGVLVVPAEVKSEDEWQEKFGSGETIDVTPNE